MKAIGVTSYGPVDNLVPQEVPSPTHPTGRDLLIAVKATSVNPIDVKIRAGIYDDAPDYYSHVPSPFHIIAPDGAGTILEVGPDVQYFKPGDDVFYGCIPTRQGAASELQLVDERLAAHKPASWDFVQAAALPVTAGTAWDALCDRLEIKKNEQAAILIINGSGGVGSMASQMARRVFNLPVVITTASRPETIAWSYKMGATHVINHREDLRPQIEALQLKVPLKYIFILHSTAQYLSVCSDICEPLGKVCSVVQSDVNFYGTQFLSKSLTFAWCWLGSRMYHHVQQETLHAMMGDIARWCNDGTLESHLTQRLKLTVAGLREAHRLIEGNATVGKVGLGINEEGEGEAFA